MKTLSVKINSKPIQTFISMVGFLFLLSAWYVSQSASTTTEYFFGLQDIQIEALATKGIDPNLVVLNSETVRDIATKFNSHINLGVIGMVLAGCLFLLLGFGLSVFNVSVNNKVHTLQTHQDSSS